MCISPRKTVQEMTYTVSGGTLNLTHSLTQSATVMRLRPGGVVVSAGECLHGCLLGARTTSFLGR